MQTTETIGGPAKPGDGSKGGGLLGLHGGYGGGQSAGGGGGNGGDTGGYSAPAPSSYDPAPDWTRTQTTKLQPYTGSVSPSTISGRVNALTPPAVAAPVVDFVTDTASSFRPGAQLVAAQEAGSADRKKKQREEFEQSVKEKTYKPRKTYEMTWDDYLALSERGRAAVDFNTMLIGAREKDLNQQEKYDPAPAEEKQYNRTVKKMFGADGGSDVYAPATLGVLESIDFKDKTEDLDNFLGLKSAITEKDLAKLEMPGIQSALGVPLVVGGDTEISSTPEISMHKEIVEGVQGMEQSMVEGDRIKQNFLTSAKLELNQYLQAFGGFEFDPRLPAGFRPLPEGFQISPDAPEDLNREAAFRGWFDELSKSTTKGDYLGQVIGDIESTFSTLPAAERRKFIKYVDDRTRDTELYGLDPGKGYRTPEQFREMFGLAPLKINKE